MDGPARNLIGGVIHTGRGSAPGLTVVKREDTTMAKASTSGIYTLNGRRFKVRKGDPLPEGAEVEQTPEERAVKAAPENKSKPAAPETKAKANAPETKAK